MSSSILFLQAGGTIDKDYPRVNSGYAFEIEKPAVERILPHVEAGFEYEIQSVVKKDSLDMKDEDRERLKEACLESSHSKIIITHGSDTLIETAKYLGNLPGKVVVLTGAYRPERFQHSDAAFNIGCAVGALSLLKEGTWLAMNGKVMRPHQCMKNVETGKFEEVST